MGSAVARVLIEHNLNVITCLQGRSQQTAERSREVGIRAVPELSSLIQESDLLLSILVPSEALSVAEDVSKIAASMGQMVTYVDCNAIAPATAEAIGAKITGVGGHFIDAGIIGPPPSSSGRTRFYTSGQNTGAFEALGQFGLDIRIAGEKIGQAAGFKMTYAALTKGTAALSLQLLVAAKKMGLYEALLDEFEISQEARLKGMISGLPGVPSKAGRWIGEMEEIAKTFEDLALTPRIYQGAADMYRLVDDSGSEGRTQRSEDGAMDLRRLVNLLAEQ
jgi:3-hydroxyisobutyrate dehydrogenase-like beta-hydroxyacid dehydrogenase